MRKLAIVASALVIVLVGLGLFVVSRIDTYLNENRVWLAKQVEDAIGRRVQFGALGVSFSGGVGASIADLRVGEDPAFGEGDFVALDEAVVRVKIWPALFGRYEVSSVMLRRPRITLIQTATGMNIDSLGETEPSGADAGSESASVDGTSTDSSSMFAIALFDIEDGELRYIDRSGAEPAEFNVRQLTVRASDLSTEKPIDFELSANVLDASRPNLEASGRVGPMAAASALPLELTLSLSPIQLETLTKLPQLAGALAEGQNASGPIDLIVSAKGTADQLAFEVKVDASDASLNLPDTLEKPVGTPLSFETKGRYAGDVIDLDSGTLTFSRAMIDTRGRINLAEATTYDLKLTSRDTPLGGWEALLPALAGMGLDGRTSLDLGVRGDTSSEASPALAGSIALQDVVVRMPEQPEITGLATKIQLADGGLVIPDSSFELAGSPCTISGRIPDLAHPSLSFKLVSPHMRGESIGLSEPDAKVQDELRALRIEGTATPDAAGTIVHAQVASGGGTIAGVAFEDLKGRLRADSKLASVDDLVVRAFGGSATARATYDLTDTTTPGWTLNLSLAGIQAAQLAASRLGFASDMFDGKINSNFALEGRGFDTKSLATALTGDGNIDVVEGLLKKVNLGELVLQKATGVSGLSNLLSPEVRTKHRKLFAEGTTAFRELRSAFTVRDGRVHAKNLKIDAFDYGLSGEGSIGLDGDVKINALFKTSPELTDSLTKSAKVMKYLADSKGRIEIPLTLGGSLDGISVKPDLKFVEKAMERAAGDALQDKATNLINKALLGKKKKSTKKSEPAGVDEGATSQPPPAPESAPPGPESPAPEAP